MRVLFTEKPELTEGALATVNDLVKLASRVSALAARLEKLESEFQQVLDSCVRLDPGNEALKELWSVPSSSFDVDPDSEEW